MFNHYCYEKIMILKKTFEKLKNLLKKGLNSSFLFIDVKLCANNASIVPTHIANNLATVVLILT